MKKKNFIFKTSERQAGFTLVEVIMVTVIVAVLMAIAVPNIREWLPNMHLKATARDIFSDMQKAKMAAIKSNTTVTFTFAQSTGSPCQGGNYTFQDSEGNLISFRKMEDGVCLSTSSNFPAGFLPNGLPSGTIGTVKLSHPDSSRTYLITQTIAGGIRLQ